jgi:hypothetical protein
MVGSVAFDRAWYNATHTAVVTVQDAGFNSDPASAQTMTVRITSGSDSWGIPLTLTETGPNTSVFASAASGQNLGFTSGASDPVNSLIHVAPLDQIYVTYSDVEPAVSVTNSAWFDSVPPQTTLTITGPDQTAGGTNIVSQMSTCALAATDTGAGVSRTLYSMDGGAWVPYTSPFGFTSDGTHVLTYQSADLAGNWETPHQQQFVVQTQAPQFAQTLTMANGGVNLLVSGQTGVTYTLQVSTDLVHWTPLQTFTCTSQQTLVVDSTAGNLHCRFYRITWP